MNMKGKMPVKTLLLGCAMALALAAPAIAENNAPPEVAAMMKITDKLIVHDADVKPITVYEWERNGVQHNGWPGQEATVPYDAAKVTLKLFNFPTGQLRKLYFAEGVKTPIHFNHDDIILYSLGTSQVEVIGPETFVSHPGDASLHPTGVMHYSQTLVPGWRAEFAFKSQYKSGIDATSLSGRDKTLHQVTEWVEGGQRKVAYDKKDQKGAVSTAKIFQFPGYELIEARLPKGNVLPVHMAAADRLLYVVSGKLKVTSGSESGTVTTGDMVRVAAGKPFAREALEDTVLVDVEASKTPG